MRRLGLILWFALFAACSVHLSDPAGRACDETHACLEGRVCVAGQCVTPPGSTFDGGGADAGEQDGGPPDGGDQDASVPDDGGQDGGLGVDGGQDGGVDGGEVDAGSCANDPTLGNPCTSGQGPCQVSGHLVCSGGQVVCDAVALPPGTEICDGVDNDCDGVVDNHLTQPACPLTQGVCASGTRTCQGAAGWTADCDYGVNYEPVESSCDGLDNDCDGVADPISQCLYNLAGDGPGGFRDGNAATARFSYPQFLTPDSAGNLYVPDAANHALRVIDSAGNVTTFSGDGTCSLDDGPIATAHFCEPSHLVIAPDGVTFYVSDTGNNVIRKISNGTVTTLAGSGAPGFLDANGLNAQFDRPLGMVLTPSNTLLIADYNNNRIRELNLGTLGVTTYAGTGTLGYGDAAKANMQLAHPVFPVLASTGVLYVSEKTGDNIRAIPPTGSSSTLAGSTTGAEGYVDGVGSAALFNDPTQILLDEAAGVIYVAEGDNGKVRQVPLNGTTSTSTLSGGLSGAWVNTSAGKSQFDYLWGLAKVGQTWFFADENHLIRKAAVTADLTTSVTSDFTGGLYAQRAVDGTGEASRMWDPIGLVRLSDGSLLVTEMRGNLLRKVTPQGLVTTLIGNTSTFAGGTKNGALSAASLSSPRHMAVGPDGKVYIAEGGDHAIRVVDLAAGTVATFTGGSGGYADGTLAAAKFSTPVALAFGKDGTGAQALYVADQGNHVVRKILFPSGPVSTLAGVAGQTGTTDGALGTGKIATVRALCADDAGHVYDAETSSVGNLVRAIAADGTLTTLQNAMPSRVEALWLEGGGLMALQAQRLDQLTLVPQDALNNLFVLPRGWRGGLVGATAQAGDLIDAAADANAIYLLDSGARRVRRLWR